MKKRLGEYLLAQEKLQPEQLDRALKLQEGSGERLGRLLVQLGFVAERDVARCLAEQLDLPFAESGSFPQESVLEQGVSHKFLLESQILPLKLEEGLVHVAMATPQDEYAINALKMACNCDVVVSIAAAGDIEAALNRAYTGDKTANQDQTLPSQGDRPDDVQQLRDLASEAPVIRQVNTLISRALELGASDIHFEPFPDRLRVRFRVDGALRDVESPAASLTAAIISRIKIMSNLDIAERRLPQDGRISLRIEGKAIDMRVSTVPTTHGESVVMRILDKQAIPLDFSSLGFTPSLLQAFQNLLELPHGIILVTGPTGSGKTTTLYAALETLNDNERKILTVEDPVEYQLDGINQIHVKTSIGLTFASALRSILRQDPDVIMIGEMRDLETAKIAVQSALTGHKVFSTLHTNTASSSITRLLDMGVEDYLVTSTVNGVLAQRLVRKLCQHCCESYTPLPEFIEEMKLGAYNQQGELTLKRATGCEQCENSGYQGRTTVLELMVMNDVLRQAILKRSDAASLQQVAEESGMRSMYNDGLDKAAAGITSIEEVARVSQESW